MIEASVIFALLLLNGLFAMYEIALVSSSKVRLEMLESDGNKSASIVLKQLANPEKTLSAIQIGITLIGIVSGAYGGVAIAKDIVFLFASIPLIGNYAYEISMFLTISAITYLSLVLGELVPKSLAMSNPEKYALFFAPIIRLLTIVCFPIVWVLSVSTRLFNSLIGISSSDERPLSEEELKAELHRSSSMGIIGTHEFSMLNEVFGLSNKRISDLMTPRSQMAVLRDNYDKRKIVDIIKNNNFSKYFLFSGGSDSIVGVVSAKDVLFLLENGDTADLRSIAKKAYFLPENTRAKMAVEFFNENKTSIVAVIDEHGTIEGMLTIYDLAESVFGDIIDGENVEKESKGIAKEKDGSFIVDASLGIDSFKQIINREAKLPSGDYTSVGGMVITHLGRIPEEGETIILGKFKLTVLLVRHGKVIRLRLEK